MSHAMRTDPKSFWNVRRSDMYAWNALVTMDGVHQSISPTFSFSVQRFEELLSTSEIRPGKTACPLDLDSPKTPVT